MGKTFFSPCLYSLLIVKTFQDANAKDDDDDDSPSSTVRGLNFSVPTGRLVAVVGSVGAGKTTILASLLGETEKLSGKKERFLIYAEM